MTSKPSKSPTSRVAARGASAVLPAAISEGVDVDGLRGATITRPDSASTSKSRPSTLVQHSATTQTRVADGVVAAIIRSANGTRAGIAGTAGTAGTEGETMTPPSARISRCVPRINTSGCLPGLVANVQQRCRRHATLTTRRTSKTDDRCKPRPQPRRDLQQRSRAVVTVPRTRTWIRRPDHVESDPSSAAVGRLKPSCCIPLLAPNPHVGAGLTHRMLAFTIRPFQHQIDVQPHPWSLKS